MGISSYISRLRDQIGHELLLIPSVAVLARDEEGRLLLMRATETGCWQTIGGAIDPDESPSQAAVREAREEAGVDVELRSILAALGGPQYRWTYANDDEAAYVTVVYDALVVGGTLEADGEEASEVGWWAIEDLPRCEMNRFTRSLLTDTVLLVG